MRKSKLLLLAGCVAIFVAIGMGLATAHDQDPNDPGADCPANTADTGNQHRHTAAGSCKDDQSGNWHIDCDSDPTVALVAGIGIWVSPTSTSNPEGPEVEACNEEGNGNFHGRLVVDAQTANPNPTTWLFRVSLDSDAHQSFPAGYINVQVDPVGTSGVYCAEDEGANSVGDGYSQPAAEPGTDGSGVNTTFPPTTPTMNDNNEAGDRPGPAECLPLEENFP